MNYKKIYDAIIEKRLETPAIGYIERHHIIPVSLGGGNKDNIVKLTAREHFICHYLLTKIYSEGSVPWKKMNRAFTMMLVKDKNQDRYIPARKYEKIRIIVSKIKSENQSGAGNSHFGTMWIYNLELEKSMKIKNDETIPDGWQRGLVINFSSKKKKIEDKELREKAARDRIEKTTEKYRAWYKIYDAVGFKEFVKSTGYDKSKQALVMGFSKYLLEFVPQNGKKRGI